MKRKITGLCVALISFIMVTAQQGKLLIDAVIRDLPADSVVYWSSIGSDHDDSVKTAKGSFHIEIPIRTGEGNVYVIQIGSRYNEDCREVLYLDEGKLLIAGDGPQFKEAKLTGSQYVLDYNDFLEQVDNSPALRRQKELYARTSELEKTNDTGALATVLQQLRELDSIRTVLSKSWISSHPSSAVSAYALLFYVKKSLSAMQLDSMLQQLSPEAKNNRVAKNLAYSVAVDQKTGLGKAAMDFTQNDTSGNPVSLHDFRGKYVLLDFWASWCQPCRMENPNVVAAFNKFGSKNFTILSVSLDQQGGKQRWMKAIHEDGLTWTHVSDLNCWNNAAAKLYDIQSIPSNILIDPGGNIIAKNLRTEELDKKLSELLPH